MSACAYIPFRNGNTHSLCCFQTHSGTRTVFASCASRRIQVHIIQLLLLMASEELQAECIDVVAVLPEYLRPAIPFKTFNRIQANCLESWNSDNNIIINAPTGTGKTVCFELSILRHVHKTLHAEGARLLSPGSLLGKMVYIAPTKSICSERQADWHKRYSYLGMNVNLVTGDSATSDLETKLFNADLIITTAEMWDGATRRKTCGPWSDICNQVSLLLVDEVHHVGEQRGAVMESVVTRMILASRNACMTSGIGKTEPIASLRIVAASATVGNINDLGRWLRVPLNCIKCFDDKFRPVSLEYHVIGYTAQNPWLYGRVYEKQILKVLLQYGKGKPAIVFCTSRNQTITCAQTLRTQICGQTTSLNHDENVLTRFLSKKQRDRLKHSASKCSDPLLASLLPHGVAFHNADISLECRGLVEELFKESLLICLFSTSTLAQGVNLPARLVIVAGTTVYHDGQLREYNRNKLLQMCGRAGRIGLDNHGIAVIMTARSNVHLYKNIRNDTAGVIESKLDSDLENVINAEIARQSITDISIATLFIRNSFFWARMVGNQLTERDSANDAHATELALKSIQKLVDMNLVRYDEDLYGLETTLAGAYMAEYCVSLQAMRILGEKLPNAKRPSHVLRVISSCPEVIDGAFLRRSERKKLNEMNQFIRMPVIGKVKDPIDKVFVLLQIAISERPCVDLSLRNESNRLLQAGSRLCSCIIDLLLSQALPAPYDSLTVALQVSRALLNKCSWHGSTVFRQIYGMTVAQCQMFWKNGIKSIANLSKLDAQSIADVLGGCTVFADRVRRKLRQIPKFTVEIEIAKNSHTTATCEVESMLINVDVASQIGNELRGKKKLRGFIVVSYENHGVVFSKKFDMNDSIRRTFSWDMTASDTTNTSRIDVLVGCDSIIGVDWFGRFFYDHKAKMLKNICNEKKGGENVRTNPFRPRLSVTTGRVSKRTLCSEGNARMRILKRSFLTSIEKLTAPERAFRPTCESNNQEGQQMPSGFVASTRIVDAPETDQDEKRGGPLFGSRCEGVTIRRTKTYVQSLRRTDLKDSAKSEAREYDKLLRSLY
eukprot:gb/GEZJ01005007.1/.p1 GENE.gb/GEZJ01005007.1/~~gb/GEZJ01005007.1/.p1  ORF type:complete len:1063 (-),score=129.66 gb/GEZJ01005007.1/:411-3599(-)